MTTLNKFITDELALRFKHYSEDPASIIEHFNIEQQNIQTYNGRQLLEMLQNADDASGTATKRKIFIKLLDDKLIIGNNGEAFTKEGFLSITRSNLSPKTMQQNKIGQKGLGFRSILSWADEVEIHSGGIRLGFSEHIAQSFLQKIVFTKPEVAIYLKSASKSEFPIATLRVPQLLDVTKDENFSFDTIIELKLKENIFSDVQSQINSVINKETLIFLNHIDEIEIDSPERKIIFKKESLDDLITVSSNDFLQNIADARSWHLNKISGKHGLKNYELSIAWNDELNDSENVIYSNFKTQARFPFPALLHGTFELTQNRNQLENDTAGHNEFLTEKLAELLIDTSLKIADYKKKADYFPLKLLNIDFDKIDAVLANFKFKDKLIERIKSNKVFPSVNGKYISYISKPVYYDIPVANFLRGIDVDQLLLHCSDEKTKNFVKSFGIYHFSFTYFIKLISTRLRNYRELSMLIFLLLNDESYKGKFSSQDFSLSEQPPLLMDSLDNPIDWRSKIFLQPENGAEFNLPALSVKFVHPKLINYLLQDFATLDITILLGRLAPLRIRKYSFLEIAETLIEHFRGLKNLKAQDVKDLHRNLFRLFKNESKGVKPDKLSEKAVSPVLVSKTKIKFANEVYFSKEYGNNLTEQLYKHDRSKLLAEKKYLGLEKADEKLIREYFAWLGIVDLPRYFLKDRVTNKQDKYIESSLRGLKYPTVKWGWSFKNYNELKDWLPWSITLKVAEFDGIDQILKYVKIETIFDWIKQDKQLRETLENDREIHNGASFYCYKNTDRWINKSEMKSYTKWKIATTTFIPVEAETKISSPEKCCLSKTITNEFSPYVQKPKIQIPVIAEKLLLSEEIIESYLLLIGVHREIGSFSIELLYEMLFSLKTSDKEGKVARSIYREIVNNFNESKLDVLHSSYQTFLKQGEVLCLKGNELAYFPISQAYYIETNTFGNNILKRFPLVCIDRKRGNKKVERLFGVKSLEQISFKLNKEPELHPLNTSFNEEINRFKALIYTLRIFQDTRHEIKNRLKRLKIALCTNLDSEFIHNGISVKFELESYEFIVTKNKSSFYILISNADNLLEDLRQNIRFCDSISEIFTSLINTEEYRDFIHDLYSKREVDREPRLLNILQLDTNALVVNSKEQLEIIDDLRLSFWRAFAISTQRNIKAEIRSELELNFFLQKKLKLDIETSSRLSLAETFTDLTDLATQEILYGLFLNFKGDYTIFSRHFSELNFAELFKNTIEDYKRKCYVEFSFRVYSNLKSDPISKKEKYFDILDHYNDLTYYLEEGFIPDIKKHFSKIVQKDFGINLKHQPNSFSFQNIINNTIGLLSSKGVIIPWLLKENRRIQTLLLFEEIFEIKKEIDKFNAIPLPVIGNQIKVRGTTIEYDDFQSLAKQVLQGIDISKLKFKVSKTIGFDDKINKDRKKNFTGKNRNVRFNNKNEEQIGFITELMCYHKLCDKYGEQNINWVSENAYRAYPEKFLVSEAGKGYDLEIKDENGKVRFIEIKGVANILDGIKMTKEEIRIALSFPEKYDLLIVENPLSSEPFFRLIKSSFKFKSEESLFSNKKLKVFNDNYVIKFHWDE